MDVGVQDINITVAPAPVVSLSISGSSTAVSAPNVGGPKGDTGATGPASSLTIGTVTEGAAAALITGDAPNQILSLTLPRGEDGTDGYNPMTVSALAPSSPQQGDLWYKP